MLLQRVGERHFEVGLVERLADEVGRAKLHRLHDRGGAALAREHDDRHIAIDFLERRERVEAVHLAGHDHVENHRRRPVGVVALDRFFGVADGDGLVAALRQKRAQEVAHRRRRRRRP